MKVEIDKYNTLISGGYMIINEVYKPGKVCKVQCTGQPDVKARCTSNYGPPMKSSFLLHKENKNND